jgi:hypothetical protein
VRSRAAGLSVGLAGIFAASAAAAEPPWVDRHIVLPEHDWAFDLGLGIAHDEFVFYTPGGAQETRGVTGPGLNFEASVSPVDRLELGFRTGLRIGDDARATQADAFGRLFDRQTFGTKNDVAADPELRVRGALLRGSVAEIGLEGRVFLPAEQYSEVGILFGVPFLFHLGMYVPVVFYSPVNVDLSVPLDVWFQATRRLWLGPMTGFVYNTNTEHTAVQLGVGLGYQIVRFVDLKTQFLFPDLNQTQGAATFGFGVGVEVRIE